MVVSRTTRAALFFALIGLASAAGETCTAQSDCLNTEVCQCVAASHTTTLSTTNTTDASPGHRFRTPVVNAIDTTKMVAAAAYGAFFAPVTVDAATTCTCFDITASISQALTSVKLEPQTPIQAITTSSSKRRRRRLLGYAFDDVLERKVIEDPTSTLFAFPNNILCAITEASGFFGAFGGWNTVLGNEGKTIKSTISVANCPWESSIPPEQVWVAQPSYQQKYVVDGDTTSSAYIYASIDVWATRKGVQDANTLDIKGRVTLSFVAPSDGSLKLKDLEFQFDAPSQTSGAESHVGFIKKSVTYDADDWTTATATAESIAYYHKWSFLAGSLTDIVDAAIISKDLTSGITDARGSYLDVDNSVTVSDMTLRDDGKYVSISDGQTVCLDKQISFETGYQYRLYDLVTGTEVSVTDREYAMAIALPAGATVTDYNGNAVTPTGNFFSDTNRNVGSGFGCRSTSTRVVSITYDNCYGGYFMLYRIPDGSNATLTKSDGSGTHHGKTYKIKSVSGKTVIPAAASASACAGTTLVAAAALTVPLGTQWTSTIATDVGAPPTVNPTITLLYGVAQ